ncbi:proton-conducting transporter transmembrane domain-containing protein [Nocardiopsis metallicus]|uniref:NADH:ubiquinone oxidoreductase subunit 5 (Subunit L)/multisubunit Na+/H+ antiporter MnhA subunit n=2 Tax=Nocardiopsis metallicus TaxID=179819 RepID=A0A840WET6_9ACTN|nr:proton-conducting transporter membrane subunit [Nocardiopsis metallicus]MBB5490475.1 NADH:ubiquinone oxidoreductase subunit 5 (subunit L)/multisubunit Na+/H+ antiporter MnhA subunit [Nocardiopsis metallicus]
MSALLVMAVALPGLAALVCVLASERLGDRAGALGAAAAAAALCAVVPTAFSALSQSPVTAPGLFADRLSVVMLALVLGVSAVVQSYANRYLSGDPRQARLIAAMGATTTAVAVLVSSATFGVLVAAWVASGLGLLVMLAQRSDLPAARTGLRRTAAAHAVGDLALIAAAAVLWTTIGGLDLRGVEAGAQELAGQQLHLFGVGVPAAPLVACLLLVAAMGRCALVPLHRWLPATLAAPTPVSAFMHAGLVNAGGFLLVRMGPVFGASGLATHLAFTVGALTALYGTALMLARPDAKGALAYSTIGQMGFMVMACALGAFAAVVFHLVAHGMYKATLFLSVDSAIHNRKRHRAVPLPAPAGTGWPPPLRLAAAALVPAAAISLALATFARGALEQPGAIVLLAFAWFSAARALWVWLGATPGRAAVGMGAAASVCVAYAALVAVAKDFLGPVLGEAAHSASPWLVLVPAAVMAALSLVWFRSSQSTRSVLYTRALDAGTVVTDDGWRSTTPRQPSLRIPSGV